jgi:hypothetical protein
MPKRKRATTKAKAKPSRGKVKGGKPKSRGATPKRGSTKARAKRCRGGGRSSNGATVGGSRAEDEPSQEGLVSCPRSVTE